MKKSKMILDTALPNKMKTSKLSADDSKLKSFVKALSWRIVGTIDTMVIAYFITGEMSKAFTIGTIEVFSKMILYYFHERVWNKIKF